MTQYSRCLCWCALCVCCHKQSRTVMQASGGTAGRLCPLSLCQHAMLHFAAVTAAGTLTCPLEFHNQGNVRLTNVSLQGHVSQCFTSVLWPGEVYTCNFSKPSTRQMFEDMAFPLSLTADSTPLGGNKTLPAVPQATASIPLVQNRILITNATVTPLTVRNAGDYMTLCAAAGTCMCFACCHL